MVEFLRDLGLKSNDYSTKKFMIRHKADGRKSSDNLIILQKPERDFYIQILIGIIHLKRIKWCEFIPR